MADDRWVVIGQKHRADVPIPTNVQLYELAVAVAAVKCTCSPALGHSQIIESFG